MVDATAYVAAAAVYLTAAGAIAADFIAVTTGVANATVCDCEWRLINIVSLLSY